MVDWRPPLGIGVILAGFAVFVAGGLHDVWWSWLLGIVAAIAGMVVGVGIFFSGLMRVS